MMHKYHALNCNFVLFSKNTVFINVLQYGKIVYYSKITVALLEAAAFVCTAYFSMIRRTPVGRSCQYLLSYSCKMFWLNEL